MNFRGSQPEVGGVRILFRCTDGLTPDQVRVLAARLVADSPVAPDEVEVNPTGEGFLLYRADDSITLDELNAIIEWLRGDQLMTEVWWDTIIDV